MWFLLVGAFAMEAPLTSETQGENRHVEVSSLPVTRGDNDWVSMTWPLPWKIVCVGRKNHIFQVEEI